MRCRGLRRRRACCAWPPASTRAASIRWPQAIVAAARERGLALDKPEHFDSELRHRRARHASAGAVAGAGQHRADAADWASTCRALATQAEALRVAGRQRDAPGRRRPARGPAGRVRPDQGDARPMRWRRCARRGLRVVMATGDGLTTARAVAPAPGHRRGARRGQARRQAQARRAAAGAKVASSRWPATASTTRRRWRAPTSASRWAPAPTWR